MSSPSSDERATNVAGDASAAPCSLSETLGWFFLSLIADKRRQTFPATFFAIVFSIVSCCSRSGTPYTRTKKIVLPFFT